MSTTVQQSSPSDSLALVNSFYGPGATACWYLTCLSSLISWTLHPKKRTADAITNDFIVLATFPTVASAHLITQIRSWPSELSVDDETLEQMRASLAASLIITETYLSLCIILILPGLFGRTSQASMPPRGDWCLLYFIGNLLVLRSPIHTQRTRSLRTFLYHRLTPPSSPDSRPRLCSCRPLAYIYLLFIR
jgi:hypothetical protein